MRCPQLAPRLALAVIFAAGLVLGFAGGRATKPLSAQKRDEGQGPTLAANASPGTQPAVSTSRSTLVRGDDEAIYDQLARQYERFEQVNRTFELVAKAVSPSVVHIVARKATRHHEKNVAVEETGSGVIVRPRKDSPEYVLTNNHVIDGANPAEIEIFLQDGRVLKPDKAWSDPKADIAVLRLTVRDLPAARLGDSDQAGVGSWVLALGSPFGLTHSVSQGIISARNRHEQELQEDGLENQDFLQTDAAINPGNSGGPLVNLKGEVIGINTAIASSGGGSEGVGFSIPINLARWIMDQLISTGKVRRGAMGVNLEDLTASRASNVGLDRPRGALVTAVHADSPAARIGLRPGDIIIQFNQVEVNNLNHLINLVACSPIGEQAEVVVWRERRELAHAITVGDLDRVVSRKPPAQLVEARPSGNGRTASADTVLGLDLIGVTPSNARGLGWPEDTRGVVVLKVDPSSPVASKIQPRDLIYAAPGRWIKRPDELSQVISQHAAPGPLEFWVQRPSTGQRFSVKVP
ncbi:MAG: trypsin-like peptidase domain-containing protein [Isosphaeraceae bacterium]